MEPTNALDHKAESTASDGVPPREAGLLNEVKSLWQELRVLAHDQLTLIALEARLAGNSLVNMVATGVMIAVLLISAWLALMGSAILWLIGIGVAASIAMLFAVAANLVLAGILYERMRRQSRHLQFPASLRSLRPLPSQIEASEKH